MKKTEQIAMKLQKTFIPLFIMVLLLSACGGSTETTDTGDTTVTGDVVETITTETLEEYPIPTPFEISKVLEEAGAGYIVAILNSSQDVYKYETEYKQALNLGVYGADLSYSSTYNESQETMRYLQCSQDLTEKLQIQGALTQEVLDLVAENQENKDTLYNIIKTTFFKTFDNLNNSQRGNISALVLAGGWIEGMYVSTQIAMTAQKNDAVIKGILEQKQHLQTLIATLKTYENDENIKSVLTNLGRISAEFDKVSDSISDEQLNTITKVVEGVRSSIIQ